jgi:hypothetical protein
MSDKPSRHRVAASPVPASLVAAIALSCAPAHAGPTGPGARVAEHAPSSRAMAEPGAGDLAGRTVSIIERLGAIHPALPQIPPGRLHLIQWRN